MNGLNIFLKFTPHKEEPMDYKNDILEAYETGDINSVQWLLEN